MLNKLFIYFNHYHDSKTLDFIYFLGLKMHWKSLVYVAQCWVPNWTLKNKKISSLAKSHLQWKTCGYMQKHPWQVTTKLCASKWKMRLKENNPLKNEWLKNSLGLKFLHFIFKIFKVISISQPRNIFMWLKCMCIIFEYEKIVKFFR